MNKHLSISPVFFAVSAAILFGMSTPFSKIILNMVEPVFLAAFLYLGSGFGLLVYKVIMTTLNKNTEAPLNKKDILWLVLAIVCGGIIAPISLMLGLKYAQASVASLLLNFESVSTVLIAFLVFKESVNGKTWIAISLIVLAGTLLTLRLNEGLNFSVSAIGIIGACVFWGLDNNFTRNISSKDPVVIGIIKGLGAGIVSFIIGLTINGKMPNFAAVPQAFLLGFFSYGLSIILFVLAMRYLGAARTGAIFGIAPFAGVILSIFLLKEIPDLQFYIALAFMLLGTYILMQENHIHKHTHEEITHEHSHTHDDLHHEHKHSYKVRRHSHIHTHIPATHSHEHFPDIHHRHGHEKS